MGESSHQNSRLGLRNAGGGEIVEVQGGHIVRSTGRKDRHSKVCTAKGPRDRRVRLAAHTAIQFYDVQDRLGYDRPSKAVDWLIKKAKAAIDELAQLPAWTPTTTCSALEQGEARKKLEEEQQRQIEDMQNADLMIDNITGHSNTKRPMTVLGGGEELNQSGGDGNNPDAQNSSFLPPSLDSDAIADTIKSFFPMGASGEASSSGFQRFPNSDLLSRSGSHSQDLRLSLQSFQDPIMLHHHNQPPPPPHQQNPTHHNHPEQAHVLLSGTPLGFDGWAEHHQQAAELSRLQRLASWNSGGDTATGSGGAATATGYIFNSPAAPQPLLQQLLGHNQFFSQRGPLQSSNTPSIRAWMDPSAITIADQTSQPPHNHPAVPIYPSSFSGIGFSSGVGGFSGFHIPARFQGDEEEHDGYSDKPSSASSDSRH